MFGRRAPAAGPPAGAGPPSAPSPLISPLHLARAGSLPPGASSAQDLRLLRLELRVGQDPLVVQFAELAKALDRVGFRGRGLRRRRRVFLLGLLGVLLFFLALPAFALAAA